MRSNALFSYETDFQTPSLSLDTSSGDYFSFSTVGGGTAVESSFNFLNTEEATTNPGFIGYYPSLGSEGGTIAGFERNFPRIPFAQHVWFNRPFASPYEIIMVPASSPSRLFEEFSVSSSAPVIGVTSLSPLTLTVPLHGLQTNDNVLVAGLEGLSGVSSGIFPVTVSDQNTLTINSAAATGTYVPNTGIVAKVADSYSGIDLSGNPASAASLYQWFGPFRHLVNFAHDPANPAERVPLGRLLR